MDTDARAAVMQSMQSSLTTSYQYIVEAKQRLKTCNYFVKAATDIKRPKPMISGQQTEDV